MLSARGPEGSESGLSGNTEGFMLPRRGDMTGSPLQGKKEAEQPTRSDLSCLVLGSLWVPSKLKTPNLLFQKWLQLLVDKMHV